MKQLTLSVILCLLAFGCSEVRHYPEEAVPEVSEELTPEIAKAALVEMLSSMPDDSFVRYKVIKWKDEPVSKPAENASLYIGPFQVDLKFGKYGYAVGNPSEHHMAVYGGEFKKEQNRWVATPVKLLSIS